MMATVLVVDLVSPWNPWPAIVVLVAIVLIACWLDKFLCPPEFDAKELKKRVAELDRKAA